MLGPYPTEPITHGHGHRAVRGRSLPTDLVRGSLLLGLAAMLLLKVANGTVAYYIKLDLVWSVLLAAVVLGAVGIAHLLRWAVVRTVGAGWRSLIVEATLLVPLVAGLVLPARPLDSTMLEQRGLNTVAAVVRPADNRLAALQADTSQWTLLDWSIALQQETNPARLQGQPVSVSGFVYGGDPSLAVGELSLVRFVVTCCAADGAAVGLAVRPPDATSYAADTWLQVTGRLELVSRPGQPPRPVIVADRLQPIETPRTPYLYP